ncbi:MAG: PhnD/SsuA/transferrin family substrate-binding protein [Gammaproteobacteria bacterium]|nr:PhnD/SsuA/transferrin family substrate-binding protein [Gammaproteobacteria bacterium]
MRVFAIVLLIFSSLSANPADQLVRIGVLSHRGFDITIKNWSPTAEYLTNSIPGCRFEIVPLDFSEVDPTVKFGQVDFLLVNSSIYVNMEVRYRVSRIATLDNLVADTPYNVFGGVVFVRSDRRDITTLADLEGKSLLAVDETSLGGFQMAWRELRMAGVDPYRDLSKLEFAGTHDKVVMDVLAGRVDVGTVRTNILERMASTGQIRLDEFNIVSPKGHTDFPFARSTRLYPEWPFSKLQHTSNQLAQKVAVALLNMPRFSAAAEAGNYAGWTVPLDYQSVHELFQELHLPPYQELGAFTLIDAVRRYWYWPVIALAFFLVMSVMTTWVVRLNRELQRSKLHLQRQHDLILNSVSDGISGVDLDGNSTFVNRAMEEITGWPAHELIGRNQHQLLHHTRSDGSCHQADNCPVYQTFRDQTPRFVDDDIFWKKDGSAIPVEYSSTPIRDENGQTVGSVVVFRDISERKKAEEAANQHLMELAHVARLSTMGEMASGIAHELNQPLTAIATNSHACIRMLESGEVPRERCADVMERISAQADRAGEIIRQLRQFVRKEQPERTLVDINELIAEVLILIRPEARRASVQLLTDLHTGIDRVLVQHIQIDQVILNLVRNAIEAMTEVDNRRRQLRIQTRMSRSKNEILVSVADTGPGLNEEIRGQLFNPFVTTKKEGMGLGLSISKGIIESHDGRLFTDTEAGWGVVFRFTLPAMGVTGEERE